MQVLSKFRQYQVLPLLILVAAFIIVGLGSLTLMYVEQRFVEDAGRTMTVAASGIAGRLDVLMGERYGDIQMMARSKTFQTGDVAAATQYVRWMIQAYPVYQGISLLDAQGTVVASSDQAHIGQRFQSASWFQRARESVTVHVGSEDLLVLQEGRRTGVLFASPVAGEGGRLIGVVVSQIALPALEDFFVQTLTSLQAQWGTSAHLEYLFLDRTGDLITDSRLREEGQANLKRLGVPSSLLFDSTPPSYIEEDHCRRHVPVITGYAQSKGVEDYEALRWGVLVRIDRADVLGPIRVIVRNLALAGLGMLLPLAGLLVVNIRRLEQARQAAFIESERARGSEQKFQEVLQAAPDAIVMTNHEGRIVLVNRQACELFGFSQEELQGQPIGTLIPEQFRHVHHQHYARYLDAPYPRRMGAGGGPAGPPPRWQ